MRSLRIAVTAALFLLAAVAAVAGQAAPTACATTTKAGFGRYTGKEPPSANFELRAVVTTRCGRPPRGQCVAAAFRNGKPDGVSRSDVLPASGRCRFILTLDPAFPQEAIKIRFMPENGSGFAVSETSIVVAPNRLTPFPADRGKTAAPGGGAAPAPKGTRIVGFAFVDSKVTGLGSRAKLPSGTKIYASGSTITGHTGCPTDQYGTTGLLVAVIDYAGVPVAGQLTVAYNGYGYAPIPMDIDQGRRVQYMGVPVVRNGRYAVTLELLGAKPRTLTARLTVSRTC